MQKKYDHAKIERKWQARWKELDADRTVEEMGREKFYILDMFPYPSGAGLHVGHPKGYIATDIYARMMRMRGKSVLHPMGWDSFGLPAENHAIKTGEKPAVSTEKNIATFKRQLEMLGLSYDWDREVNTSDPNFYKWTQWCFLKFWESYYDDETKSAKPIQELIERKHGVGANYYDLTTEQKSEIDDERLAFESWSPINWCPGCQTGLANEDLENGLCERCGSVVERKPMRQWVLRITKYADRMLKDLEILNEWEPFIKTMQTNWIGRKVGINITYPIIGEGANKETAITVFTTRPDTNFGATFVVTAPDSDFVLENLEKFPSASAVKNYVKAAKNKSELDRIADGRKKTGVFTGWTAKNHLTGREMPIYVADFVLGNFGTGNVVGVPGHDLRDFEFAEALKLPVIRVVVGDDGDTSEITSAEQVQEENGKMVNSGFLDGMEIKTAIGAMMDYLEEKGWGKRVVNYKIQDWVFSRQRYWGEPIPMVHCEKCGVVPVPEDELPVKLPDVEKYEPTGTGESPLAGIESWVETKCPHCGGPAKRETNTMPQWAGSSWYYLRYCDSHNNKELISAEKEKYWNPVDFYVGGAEHATRHLIYARFWHKFLFDLDVVSHIEPFTRLQHVGLIMAEDGRKMSKRWGNVINPDTVVSEYGADAMRVYEMFMGPFGDAVAWSTDGVKGCRKFLDKVWGLQEKVKDGVDKGERVKYRLLLEQTVKKVGRNIEDFKLNTAISAMMIMVNKWSEMGMEKIDRRDFERFLAILAPFAPHLTEEIWVEIGHQESIFAKKWPMADEAVLAAADVKIMIQVNGKLRGEIVVGPETAENNDEVLKLVKKNLIEGGKITTETTIVKEIYVPEKIVNLVVK